MQAQVIKLHQDTRPDRMDIYDIADMLGDGLEKAARDMRACGYEPDETIPRETVERRLLGRWTPPPNAYATPRRAQAALPARASRREQPAPAAPQRRPEPPQRAAQQAQTVFVVVMDVREYEARVVKGRP